MSINQIWYVLNILLSDNAEGKVDCTTVEINTKIKTDFIKTTKLNSV